MPDRNPLSIDRKSPPFDRYKGVHWLAPARSGRESQVHARHHLYAGRGRDNPVDVLIKVTSKPGLVYERDLENEIAILDAINRDLQDSRHFPLVHECGRLSDGRLFLITSLFDEFPLATSVSDAPDPDRLVAHLTTTVATARALSEIHGIGIFHVDLNPMNVLHRTERGRPIIRMVDFESSYEVARHGRGTFYNPPTTPGYTAPEVARQAPDARSDVFSLGAVLHTLLAGNLWVGQEQLGSSITSNDTLDDDLREALLRAIAPDPDDRYRSVAEFQAAIAAYLEQIWPGREW